MSYRSNWCCCSRVSQSKFRMSSNDHSDVRPDTKMHVWISFVRRPFYCPYSCCVSGSEAWFASLYSAATAWDRLTGVSRNPDQPKQQTNLSHKSLLMPRGYLKNNQEVSKKKRRGGSSRYTESWFVHRWRDNGYMNWPSDYGKKRRQPKHGLLWRDDL